MEREAYERLGGGSGAGAVNQVRLGTLGGVGLGPVSGYKDNGGSVGQGVADLGVTETALAQVVAQLEERLSPALIAIPSSIEKDPRQMSAPQPPRCNAGLRLSEINSGLRASITRLADIIQRIDL